MLGGITFLYFIFGILTSIQGHEECGKLLESQLYDRNEITSPDEYTWIGRVGYENSGEATTEFHCLAVLINQRYAILPAHCVLNIPKADASFIVFGDWRAQRNFTDGDCRQVKDLTQCSISPQTLDIEELVVHPQYRSAATLEGLNYNIALAKLQGIVEFSYFVQPICLPPAGDDKDKHIGQRLEQAGFYRPEDLVQDWRDQFQLKDLVSEWRVKKQVQMASLQFCSSKIWNRPLSENHMCSVGDTGNDFLWGSPLMAFEVFDGKPRNFYLVGIKISSIAGPSDDLDSSLFTRILPFRSWVLKNIKSN
ncbi:phenoloxidase-activating factor 1-like [Drosophila takahashii]|uniref:phenoloxidase-activating factor 1-like n=1 Tax=Drosophila takahashii TaxID=29030 RepID=UPI001CF915D2|nr:phenoloxidase-activating factor 1-like isoform X1 [Drosophila takahashii]